MLCYNLGSVVFALPGLTVFCQPIMVCMLQHSKGAQQKLVLGVAGGLAGVRNGWCCGC